MNPAMRIAMIVRILSTALLVYLSYTQTKSSATAILLGLIAFNIEAQDFVRARRRWY